MTEAEAAEWQAHSDNAGQVLEKVANSGEDRGDGERYIGWGQALQDESIKAAKPMTDRWKPKRAV